MARHSIEICGNDCILLSSLLKQDVKPSEMTSEQAKRFNKVRSRILRAADGKAQAMHPDAVAAHEEDNRGNLALPHPDAVSASA